MLCQRCHKNLATVRYAEVVDGKVADMHLCDACLAHQQGESQGFELSGEAPKPRRMVRSGALVRAEAAPDISCTLCESPLEDVLATRLAGCSECYRSFGRHLDDALRRRHVALKHRGKTPHIDDARARVRADLQAKRALLRTAVKEERYEEAAALRDSIVKLEAKQAAGMATQES